MPRALQERSLDTRARILSAAVEALVEGGYSGASTLRIQKLAGVSRGRLLHHYSSRDDLLVAAVAHLTEARLAVVADDVSWPDDPAERIDRVVELTWETYRQPYFWASTELWLAARSNPRLREALKPHERQVGNWVAQQLAVLFGEALTAAPDYELVRDALLTSMRGAALAYAFRATDPANDPHLPQWKELARRLLLSSPGTLE